MKDTLKRMLCIAAILAAVSCAHQPPPGKNPAALSSAKPSADGSSMIYDVGTIWNGTFISHTFVLENTGGEPWEIRDVSEGEGVRVSRFSRVIPPGGTGEVVCDVSTRRLSGPIRKRARVHFKRPVRPPLELVVAGEVKTSVVVAPETRIHFKNDAGKPMTWHFLIRSPRKADFTIREIKSFTDYLTSEYRLMSGEKSGAAGHVYDLTLTLAPETPVGNFRDLVKIHTDIPDGYPGEIFFAGTVRGPLMFRPDHLTFNLREDGSYGPVQVSISNRSGVPFAVTGVTTDSPEIRWQTTPVGNGRAQVVALRYTGTPAERMRHGTLVVMTDVTRQEHIELPYAVFPAVACGGGR